MRNTKFVQIGMPCVYYMLSIYMYACVSPCTEVNQRIMSPVRKLHPQTNHTNSKGCFKFRKCKIGHTLTAKTISLTFSSGNSITHAHSTTSASTRSAIQPIHTIKSRFRRLIFGLINHFMTYKSDLVCKYICQ